MMEIVKSHSFSQKEILEGIIALHSGPIEADITFGRGNFWRGLQRPEFCFDYEARVPGVIPADVRHLPIKSASLNSVVFDPPFLVTTGSGAKIKDHFGNIGKNVKELWNFYFLALAEIGRVLKPGGWLIFKCQDLVNSGINNFSHCIIWRHAIGMGFIAKDLFILGAKRRLIPRKQKQQLHARKYHSYFWVFQKTNRNATLFN